MLKRNRKYLRSIRKDKFNLVEFYQDKIDWNLFKYIQDRLTDVEDYGYSMEIKVCTHRMYNIYVYANYQEEVYQNGWVLHNEERIRCEVNGNDLNSIKYLVGIDANIDKKLGGKILKLKEVVKEKFNVIIDYEVFYTFCITDTKPFQV